MPLLDEAIAAHGGLERWRAIETVDVALRCGGLAFPFKGQPDALRSFRATADPRRPHVELHGIGTFDAAQPRPRGSRLRARPEHPPQRREARSPEPLGMEAAATMLALTS